MNLHTTPNSSSHTRPTFTRQEPEAPIPTSAWTRGLAQTFLPPQRPPLRTPPAPGPLPSHPCLPSVPPGAVHPLPHTSIPPLPACEGRAGWTEARGLGSVPPGSSQHRGAALRRQRAAQRLPPPAPRPHPGGGHPQHRAGRAEERRQQPWRTARWGRCLRRCDIEVTGGAVGGEHGPLSVYLLRF